MFSFAKDPSVLTTAHLPSGLWGVDIEQEFLHLPMVSEAGCCAGRGVNHWGCSEHEMNKGLAWGFLAGEEKSAPDGHANQ